MLLPGRGPGEGVAVWPPDDEEPEVESDEPEPQDVYEFEPEDDTRGDF